MITFARFCARLPLYLEFFIPGSGDVGLFFLKSLYSFGVQALAVHVAIQITVKNMGSDGLNYYSSLVLP